MSRTKKTAGTAVRAAAPAELPAEEVIRRARAEAFTDMTPKKAFEHFKPEAERVATEGLVVFTGRPLVMLANVNKALETLTPALPKVLDEMRRPRLRDVFELPSMVMGLEFASSRVPAAKLSQGEIDRLYAEAAPWRALMLDYLTVAANPLLKLVPAERVQAARAGTGKLDGAQDCVAIAGMFDEFATALAGKHPFTAEQFARVEELGTILVQQIRPGGAVKGSTARPPEAVLRDQFAAAVTERYDHLLVMASIAFGKARADELLPALRSAVRTAPSGDGAAEEPVAPARPAAPPAPLNG